MKENILSKRRGEIVFVYEKWSQCFIKAMIKEVNPSYYVLQCIAIVDKEGNHITSYSGKVGCKKGECFSNIDSLIKYRKRRDREQMQIYESRITDLKSLLSFPLNYRISNSEDYKDELAQKVYKKKVLDFFHIDLDDGK